MVVKSAYLAIDEERTLSAIGDYLAYLGDRSSTNRTLIGLSGGIDSAVLAATLVHLQGSQSLRAIYLFDRDSSDELARNARLVAEGLGIELETESIEAPMREKGLYDSPAMRITDLSPWFNRFLVWAYSAWTGETPFLSTLKLGSGELDGRGRKGRSIPQVCVALEKAFNDRHIYRRQVLELKAQEEGLQPIGAANRTEWMTGWFVKGGVDDLPFQPLRGLYKTQVRQLARFLEVPEEVRSCAPSPDMRKGITDELGIGMSYHRLDIGLDFLGGGLPRQAVDAHKITTQELGYIGDLMHYSRWKRETEEKAFPADGGPGSDLRTDLNRSSSPRCASP
jgi:NAD+ synthase